MCATNKNAMSCSLTKLYVEKKLCLSAVQWVKENETKYYVSDIV